MKQSPRQVGLVASTVLALTMALTVATASTASADPPDLSSDQAINAYLVSIGVDPAEAVWQRGLKNYAGPGCPGASWNCVRANAPIVQISAPLGTNLFSCTALECVVVQVALQGGNNGADCDREDKHDPDSLQVCDVMQANDGNPNSSNTATINQNIQQSRSLTENGASVQRARQVARITQANSLGKNHALIHQVIGQTQNAKGGGSITQSQEAHQAGTVSQTTLDPLATQLGDNTSNINQRQGQSQRASVGGSGSTITQNQNTAFAGDVNCDQPEDESYDQVKNQCANVTQHSGLVGPALAPGGGDNDSSLNHAITQRQTAQKAKTVNQSQGAFSSGEAGNKEQLSSGVSQGHATQDMLQVQSAPPSAADFQDQQTGDPRCCWAQLGNPANSAEIIQKTSQSASSPSASQTAIFVGQCESSGSCHVLQSATIDGDPQEPNECTAPVCEEFYTCTSGEGEAFCFDSSPGVG